VTLAASHSSPEITNVEATDLTQTKSVIKKYILEEFLPGERPESLDDSTELITGGVLDSIATVKLIAFLDEEFGVEVEAHEMNADYLNTLPDIARLVESRRR